MAADWKCAVNQVTNCVQPETFVVKMDDSETDHREEPGAAQYGNFRNYYTFHPPEARTSLLPPGLLLELLEKHGGEQEALLALDVGCNTGELSIALYNHLLQPEGCSEPLKYVHFMCCDIDPDLITRAQIANPYTDAITFSTLDITDVSSLGTLCNFLERFGRSSFHIGFCMSITMWIHLNHGDNGLTDFLNRLKTLCDYLLIEPQPWKCYRSAARRLRKLGRQDFDHFHTLSIRGDMEKEITEIMTKDGSSELIHRFGTTSWDRSLLLFKIRRPTELSV
ncbi:RNA 5'-monophosphate methyltransferase [Hyla sarda]|uniref:RNA 5'-monophosphate methyltransferase n=1 Tax=Hyla sarda TaxID=327740 RepID=UPI0024C24035|nr:RNA 5'-monophosphate methyltransferase [Hyla sarda]